MFGKILVPVDGSLMAEHCLPHLISMAKAYDAEVTLLHISGKTKETSSDPWDWKIRQAEARAYLKDLSFRLENAGLQVRTKVLEGKFPDDLINHLNRHATDLILISSHGLGGEVGSGLSSMAATLVQRARTSVMIARSNQHAANELTNLRYQRILVPLDGSQRAEHGLSIAIRLAHAHQAKLLLAHVIKPPEMPRRTPLNEQDSLLVNQLVESNRAEAVQSLNRLKDSLGSNVEISIFVSDNVADSLHQLVERENIDLVILNAHGMSGDPQWPYGSIASNFLANAAIPLLVVQDFARDRDANTGAESFVKVWLSSYTPDLNQTREINGEMRR